MSIVINENKLFKKVTHAFLHYQQSDDELKTQLYKFHVMV